MAVTIRAVAKVAGVSISTVSRALSAPETVAPATRERVEQVVRELGYRPNRAASGLITGRTNCLGLVVPDLANPFFADVCKGVQERARLAGYSVFIADTDEDASLEVELVRSLAKQVDGIILASARGTDDAVARLATESPLVLLNRDLDGVDSVTFDNGAGVRSLMRHLVALGHRSIAYAGGPVGSWSSRHRGEAFLAYRSEVPDLELVELGSFSPSFAGGVQAADLAIASGVTAIVSFNDLMALGLIDRLRQRGLRVPDDLSVAGFDDIPVSTMIWPNLTTIDTPRQQIGRAGVDALLLKIRGGAEAAPPRGPQIQVELIVRQSTGVAARAGGQARAAGAVERVGSADTAVAAE